MPTNEAVVVIALVVVALLISTGFAWRFYGATEVSIGPWRRRLVQLALVCNTLSLIVYALVCGWFQYIIRSGPNYRSPGFASSVSLLVTSILLSVTAVIAGLFGRGLARVLTTANGLALCLLWYMVALGTSA